MVVFVLDDSIRILQFLDPFLKVIDPVDRVDVEREVPTTRRLPNVLRFV